MVENLSQLIPLGVLTGLTGWFGNAYMERLRIKSADKKAGMEASTTLEKHRDGLTFQLLDAARSEISQMRTEIEKLRPMESHLYHLQQALDHLDALLNEDNNLRAVAEINARAFLRRMRNLENSSSGD